MRDRQRERQRHRHTGSLLGTRLGLPGPRITTWTKGTCSPTQPPRRPLNFVSTTIESPLNHVKTVCKVLPTENYERVQRQLKTFCCSVGRSRPQVRFHHLVLRGHQKMAKGPGGCPGSALQTQASKVSASPSPPCLLPAAAKSLSPVHLVSIIQVIYPQQQNLLHFRCVAPAGSFVDLSETSVWDVVPRARRASLVPFRRRSRPSSGWSWSPRAARPSYPRS